jgi:uncharacterized protein YxeA
MKKILAIVFSVLLAVSVFTIGNSSASAASINVRPQTDYIKRKSKKVYYRTKHGTRVVYHKSKHETKKSFHKSKRVTKHTYSKTKDKVTN